VPRLRRRLQAVFSGELEEQFGSPTVHQMEALQLLHLTMPHGQPRPGATMNELARRQGCALSTATALVDRLLRHGLAERVPDPEDRRVVRIVPTAKGLKRTAALQALAPLSDDDLDTLTRLLGAVAGPEDQRSCEEMRRD
jgi:DNA-binding MarR family transcriptional regulator